jgi:hypothetical protein
MDPAERRRLILEQIASDLERLSRQADAVSAGLLAFMIDQALAEARNQLDKDGRQ